MTDSYDLLERLCNLPGVAGFERIQRLLAAFCRAPREYDRRY
ncbi:MAG TPA: hypothetical protein VJ386_02960 [Candidatus Deferrimicrobiaceae bacterium]|nr:hypothetical protein [Candidatus Deferrimicrobiaceae bacterium]